MIKFVYRPITENVNVSKVSPVKEFFVLAGFLSAILVTAYFFLGLALNVLIDRMPARVDDVLGRILPMKALKTPESFREAQAEIQDVLDELTELLSPSAGVYTIDIIDEDMVNAVALPGRRIVLFTGLLNEVTSQNELAMILGHELGHFAHRDHIRALGRGTVFVLLSSWLFGTDSGVTDLLGGILSTADKRYSRGQEKSADLFALDLLARRYGHVAGATDFFKRTEQKREQPEILTFFLTHPSGPQRVARLNAAIRERGYKLGEKVPFDESWPGISPGQENSEKH